MNIVRFLVNIFLILLFAISLDILLLKSKKHEYNDIFKGRASLFYFVIDDKLKVLTSFEKRLADSDFMLDDEEIQISLKLLFESNSGLKNISVAPNGVQKFVYPLKGNEKVLGHSLVDDKREHVRLGVQKAIQQKKINFSGPYKLRQGGYGIVIRKPIYKNDQFWGLLPIVIDLEDTLEKSQLKDINNFSVSVINSKGEQIYSDKDTNPDVSYISYQIQLEELSFEIRLTPLHGWFFLFKKAFFQWLAVILLLMFLFNIIHSLFWKNYVSRRLLFEQKKFADMGQMVNAIAHQWRQPLNTLGILAQDVSEAYSADELDKEYIQNFEKDSMKMIMHMSRTIDDFRDFFAPDKNRQDFNIFETFRKSLVLIQPKLSSERISLHFKCSCANKNEKCGNYLGDISCFNQSFTLSGYEGEIQQVIMNILHNSIYAIRVQREKGEIKEGVIEAFIKADKDSVILELSDNGGGIPKEHMNKIFQPYYTTKDEGEGTGIGLYMSKLIIEKHHRGKLSAENIEGGAKFIVKFKSENSHR